MDRVKRKSPLAFLAFPLLIALLLALVIIFHAELWGLFKDREAIRGWISGRGILGGLGFILLQMIQVVIFVIPGELVQVAGGYAFGFWLGSLYSLLGITAGSVFNFYAGRLLGRPFVESLFDREKIEKIERVTGSGRTVAGFFLLFVIPGIPKDVLCYVAGVSRLRLFAFLGVSMAGRLPGILGSSYMGSAAYSGAIRGALIVMAIAAALFALGLFSKDRIQDFAARVLRGSPPGEGAALIQREDARWVNSFQEVIVDKARFDYVVYIAAAQAKVWEALIDPGITRQYWQHENRSDWKPGSKWEHWGTDSEGGLDLVGKVLEFEAPMRLALSWAFPSDEADEKKYSRVFIELGPFMGTTKLTLAHDLLEPGSEMLKGITEGWPKVLSSLKSLLERGSPLPRLW